MGEGASPAASSPFRNGLLCRCPRCGQGRLYRGILTVADSCAVCGCDLRAQDSGDGPTVFVILILGAIVVALAFMTEQTFAPPMWLHAVLWPPLILGGAFVMLRIFKAFLISMQYRHRVAGFGEPRPGDDNPARPGDDNPARPGDDNPARPGDDNPARPGDDNPARPGDDKLARPGDDKHG